MSPETITALALVGTAVAAIIAAVGGIVAAFLAHRGKVAAESSKDLGEANAAKLMLVEGVVTTLGPALDGRLSELLKAEISKAFAEGQLQGEQAQRDRSAPPEGQIVELEP